MDEHVEALRRTLREDPSDLSTAVRLARELEKLGRSDEAWDFDTHDARTDAVVLLPWLVPLVSCRSPQLAALALTMVRRLTGRDDSPFDEDLLTRLLSKNEGEAA